MEWDGMGWNGIYVIFQKMSRGAKIHLYISVAPTQINKSFSTCHALTEWLSIHLWNLELELESKIML